MPDEVILAIQQRLVHGRGREPEDFRHGDRVIITGGPLRGLEAIFDCNLSPTGRVRVLIQLLERVCPAELRATQLRPVSQAVRTDRVQPPMA